MPAEAFDLALDNLKNRLAYAGDFESGGEDIAYALYVLAANGRAAIGDLRYYAETKLDAFATPLAKAQIGAALALYGDKPRAEAVFRAALGSLSARTDATRGWRSDYGSDLRDSAATLTLASEARAGIDLVSLSSRVEAERLAALLYEHAGRRMVAACRACADGEPVGAEARRRWRAARRAALPRARRGEPRYRAAYYRQQGRPPGRGRHHRPRRSGDARARRRQLLFADAGATTRSTASRSIFRRSSRARGSSPS